MKLKAVWLILLWGLLPLAAMAETATVAGSGPLQKVSLQLKWRHQFQFAGYYAAIARGYYRDVGLDVSLREADNAQFDPFVAVLEGSADFGTGNPDLLLYRERGFKPLILAVIFQHSPLALVTLEQSNIRHQHDLAGRRVQLEGGAAELQAFFRRERLDPNAFKVLPHHFDTSALLNGQVDAMSVYVTDELYELKRQGLEYRLFQPASAGIDFYGDNLFTRRELLQQNPDLVRRFRAASLRGWEYALAHPAEIIDLIYERYSQRHSREHLWFEALETLKLVQPQMVAVGYSHAGRWRHIADVYAETGQIAAGQNIDDLVYSESHTALENPVLYSLLAATVIGLLLIGAILGYIIWLNRRLHSSREHYRVIYESSPQAIVVADSQLRIREWNRAAEQIFGWNRDDVLGRELLPLLLPDGERERARRWLTQREPGSERQLLQSLRHDGRRILCAWMVDSLSGVMGRPGGILIMAEDITHKHQLEKSLRQRAVAIEAAAEAILIADPAGRIEYANSAAIQLMARCEEELIGERLFSLFADEQAELYDAVRQALQSGQVWRRDVRWQPQDRSLRHLALAVAPLTDEQGQLSSIVTVGRDITAERELHQRLEQMAHTDALTGLPNRALFFERCLMSMARAKRNRERLALFFIDLDGFKRVNDTAGHAVGDRVLAAVGERLRRLLRDSDIVARIGGDEFVVLLHELLLPDQAEQVANKVLALFDTPYLIGEHSYDLGVSIGIALYPDDGEDVEALLNHADSAMYQVKSSGKGGFSRYHG